MRIVSIEECMNYYIQGLTVELCTIGDEMPCSGYNGSPLLLKYGDTHFLVKIYYLFMIFYEILCI